MANATRNVRAIFDAAQCSLTLTDIKLAMPELKSNQISMALCYFIRKGELVRKQVLNEQSKGRRNVWLYSYSPLSTKETT